MSLKHGRFLDCFNCGKSFYRREGMIGKSHFCSFACYRKSIAITKIKCRTCGALFKPKNKGQIHCSHKCSKIGPQNPMWRGGIAKRCCTRAYKDWRNGVLKRDGSTCQACGLRGVRLHAHHVKSYRDFPELRHKISNGITLCLKCHSKTPDYGIKSWKQFKQNNKPALAR